MMCLRNLALVCVLSTLAHFSWADSSDSSYVPESVSGLSQESTSKSRTPKEEALKLLNDITTNDQELRQSLQEMTLLYQNSESLLNSTSLENKALKVQVGIFWPVSISLATIIAVETAILVLVH